MTEDFFELAGTALHGKFRVDEAVGEGGFGVVYRGFHLAFEQPVAIKCLKIPRHFTREARDRLVQRFQTEGKVLARLSQHPSITRVYDLAVASGSSGEAVPYLVMEWLDGRDLEALLRERLTHGGPFGEREALTLLREPMDALAFAHEQGVAHRDIKPANVFVADTPRGQVVKLLDFGIAKLMQDGERLTRAATKTSSGFSAFTPGYAAPEQFRSDEYGESGPWTDVHALGLILVEMVSGTPALPGESGVELYQACMLPERPTPRRRGATVTNAFESLCARALSLRPGDRFADMGQMLAAAEPSGSRQADDEPRPGLPPDAAIRVGGPSIDANADTQLPVSAVPQPTVPAAPPADWLPPSTQAAPAAVAETAPHPPATLVATVEAAPRPVVVDPVAREVAPPPAFGAHQVSRRPGRASRVLGLLALTAATGLVAAILWTLTADEPETSSRRAAAEESSPAATRTPSTSGQAATASAFDREAARSSLAAAAEAAARCKTASGPTGEGTAKVTFAPTGRVTRATVGVGPPFAGTAVGNCVAIAFKRAKVPPFSGSPVTVSRSFVVE